jgi:hypothetical protein
VAPSARIPMLSGPPLAAKVQAGRRSRIARRRSSAWRPRLAPRATPGSVERCPRFHRLAGFSAIGPSTQSLHDPIGEPRPFAGNTRGLIPLGLPRRSGGTPCLSPNGEGYRSAVRLNRTPSGGWSRDQRRAAITALLSAAMIEIRTLASRPDSSKHPDGHLAEIRLIADVCHNLPGADQPQPAGEYDGLVWTWQTANDFQRSWLRKQFTRAGIDTTFLEQAPRLPRPATAPDTRPTWRRWQWPRDPGTFIAVDSNTLANLVRQAQAVDHHHPTYGPVRNAFIEWFLDHLHPPGRHILRPCRPGETLFRSDGPDDVRQYRALVTMRDGALIVDHPRLRVSDVATLPTNLHLLRRLQLAAVPPRGQERDAGLWARHHRTTHPDCRDWTAINTSDSG